MRREGGSPFPARPRGARPACAFETWADGSPKRPGPLAENPFFFPFFPHPRSPPWPRWCSRAVAEPALYPQRSDTERESLEGRFLTADLWKGILVT